MKCGFTGGLVIDYPNSTKAKKYFLCLFAGESRVQLPSGLDGENPNQVGYSKERKNGRSKSRKPIKDKDWVLKKKELYRARGKDVPADSKYTARKRRPKF